MAKAGEDQARKEVRWTETMEDAYQAALEHVGGLEAAKPKAVLELLQGQFPHLTIQNVKWHLLSHRRRQERHREMVPAGIAPPTKWNGRLEEVYEAEVARQGGLHAARPKALLDALQEQFPELTLQIVKWHLQGQRRREQRTGQDGKQPAGQGTGQAGKQAEGQVTALGGASGGQPSGSTGAPSAEAPTPAQQIPSEAAKAAPLVQHTPVLPPQPEEEQAEAEQAQEEQQAAEADSPQVDATPSPAKVASFKPDVFLEQLQALTQLPPQQLELLQHLLPASLAQAPQQQGQGQQRQQQQQQQQLAQQQQQPQAAHLLEDLQQLLTASLEQQMPQQQQGQQQQPPSVPLQLEDLQQQQLLTASLAQHHQQQQAQQHTPQLQQQQQAMAGVQGPLGGGLPRRQLSQHHVLMADQARLRTQRLHSPPWQGHLDSQAHAAREVARKKKLKCAQMVAVLADRLSKLEHLLQLLQTALAVPTVGLPSDSGTIVAGLLGLDAFPSVSSRPCGIGQPLLGAMQQHFEFVAAAPFAMGASGCADASGSLGSDDGEAHLASCRIPNCRRCAYERRLLRRSQPQQAQHAAQQQQQQGLESVAGGPAGDLASQAGMQRQYAGQAASLASIFGQTDVRVRLQPQQQGAPQQQQPQHGMLVQRLAGQQMLAQPAAGSVSAEGYLEAVLRRMTLPTPVPKSGLWAVAQQ